MAWSARQIGALAGTSLRAMRHSHEIGLLAEPARSTSGAKRYGAPHPVRVPAPSAMARARVVASDGVLTTGGTLTVPNKAPADS